MRETWASEGGVRAVCQSFFQSAGSSTTVARMGFILFLGLWVLITIFAAPEINYTGLFKKGQGQKT
jgi:hypothetical protein